MFETLMELVHQVSGTPYVTGGDSPAGTDCSGLASWVSNVASGRPAFGDRFHTANEESALLARGFQHGTAPGALVVGWNSNHTAVTLPDGTPVSSGEGGGVKIGGGGAYQPQFTRHMFLPVELAAMNDDQPADGPAEFVGFGLPAPEPPPEPEPEPAEFGWAPAPPPPEEAPAEPEAAPMEFEPAPEDAPGEPEPALAPAPAPV